MDGVGTDRCDRPLKEEVGDLIPVVTSPLYLINSCQVVKCILCFDVDMATLHQEKNKKKTKPYYDLDRLCPEISPGCKKQFHSISLVNFLLSNNLDIQNGNAACVESSRSRLAV